jgi:hypothetical protein
MSTTFYLLDNEHLATLKGFMQKEPDKDLWVWNEDLDDSYTMDDLINKAIPTTSEQDLKVNPLVIPEGKFVVGVGVGYMDGEKIVGCNSDLFPYHTSDHNPLTSLLCLRRDLGNVLVPKDKRVKGTTRTGFTLDNANGYYALRINGLYE